MIEKVIEGKAYIEGGIHEVCIGIERGKIVDIRKVLDGKEKIRIKRGIILPSGIDMHVHFREPGYEYKEDFSTGSLSALFGGVTCIADMPNTDPPTIDLLTFRDKLAIAGRKTYVDFVIYIGITEKNIDNLDELIKMSRFFKVYLGESTGSLLFNPDDIKKLRKVNGLFVFHAEHRDCIEEYKFMARDLKEYAKSRPSVCEAMAIRKILKDLGDSTLKTHIAHVSSLSGLKELEYRSNNITVGVTPHHLFFNVEQNFEKPSIYKVNPPIRDRLNQEGLLEAFMRKDIDVLESDHAPHSLDEKMMDFEDAPCGIPGVETMYPIMLHHFVERSLPLSRLVEAMCEKPADILGVKKGRIEKGRDADMAVFDIKRVKTIDDGDIHYKCGFTPFKGFKAIFPEKVFIRGEEAVDGGECLIDEGFGRYMGDVK